MHSSSAKTSEEFTAFLELFHSAWRFSFFIEHTHTTSSIAFLYELVLLMIFEPILLPVMLIKFSLI